MTQSMHAPSAVSDAPDVNAVGKPVALLAAMMFLLPALGVPSELMLQDTLKSAVVAFGVLGAALLFFWQQRQRSAPLQWHGLVWLPIVLMGYALGSMAWSHTYLAGVEAIRWFLFALLLWLGLNTLTPHNLPRLLWGIHGGAVAASLWAALQFWLDFRLFPQGAAPASTFINRNFFAEYVVCTVPFSVFLLANLRSSRWLPWVAGSLALNLVALMMTGTRSALVALWVMVPVLVLILVKYRQQFAFLQWSRASRTAVVLVLVAGVVGLGSLPSGNPSVVGEGHGTTALQRSFARTSSMAQPTEYTRGSFSIRSVMWKATARMVMAHPWTGVGAGAWEVQIPLYQNTDTTLETDYYAHNEFLQLLGEYGAVVGGLVLAFFLAYWLYAVGATGQLRDAVGKEAALRSITLTSLLALGIVSNAGFPWHLASCAALLALCMAILAGSDARLGNQQAFFAAPLYWKPGHSRACLALLTCGLLLAIYITMQAAQAERKIVHAIQLSHTAAKLEKSGTQTPAETKAQLLQEIRDGIAINSHYRRLTAVVAEPFAAAGDWENAVWILETVAASRPHVVAIWSGLASGYAHLGQHERAMQALQQVKRLRPTALATDALEISLLSRANRDDAATKLLHRHFDQGVYNYDMVQMGYAIGYKTHNWQLAIRSLELRNTTWPINAADGHFRLGNIYADTSVRDDAKALREFRSGLEAVPLDQKENYRQQVPAPFRSAM
ncbi:MAG: O-antigen ligase family protein [Rhodoferax sp.]